MSRKIFEYGGWIAGGLLVVFGVIAIVMGVNGRNEVRDALAAQQITATPDAAQITNGALQPGEAINTGAQARQFAKVMEHHALEATKGQRYAEMGRFLTASGQPTNDEAKAAKDPKTSQPVENGAPEPLGHRDRAHDRAEHVLHGRAALAVRDRGRRRAPADGHRVPGALDRRGAPQGRGRRA